MQKLIKTYLKDESGATAIEYGMIIAFISVTILVTVLAIGAWGEDTFTMIRSYF